jgi:ABC-type multidrug transport system ATPase subunit
MNLERLPAISVQNLNLSIQRKKLLQSLSFEVPEGSCFAVLGHNGAGKTTLFHAIFGLKFPSSGEIRIFGKGSDSPSSRTRAGYVPERPYVELDQKFGSFLRFHARLAGIPSGLIKEEILRVAIEVGLGVNLDQMLRTFSKGMLQKAVLAQASIGNPALMVLDEPMSGLDPGAREAMRARIRAWIGVGRTVVFSSHALEDVEELADRVLSLEGGCLKFHGSIDEWRASK